MCRTCKCCTAWFRPDYAALHAVWAGRSLESVMSQKAAAALMLPGHLAGVCQQFLSVSSCSCFHAPGSLVQYICMQVIESGSFKQVQETYTAFSEHSRAVLHEKVASRSAVNLRSPSGHKPDGSLPASQSQRTLPGMPVSGNGGLTTASSMRQAALMSASGMRHGSFSMRQGAMARTTSVNLNTVRGQMSHHALRSDDSVVSCMLESQCVSPSAACHI